MWLERLVHSAWSMLATQSTEKRLYYFKVHAYSRGFMKKKKSKHDFNSCLPRFINCKQLLDGNGQHGSSEVQSSNKGAAVTL